jgi:hypothetical protein
VLLISEDLDEIFALADRIAVMHHGRPRRAPPRADWTLAAIGLAMAGSPRMRLERRPQAGALAAVARIGAVLVTLLLTSLLVAWAGAPVGRAYALLLEGGFGSRFALTETLTRATPLILTGLAAAVAFRARLYNIGAEGQLYAGALAAVAVGGLHGGSGFEAPPWLLFPLMVAAAMAAGALLLLGPALLKSRLGVDEVVTTLLLNFIVLLFVSALLDGPMKDPARWAGRRAWRCRTRCSWTSWSSAAACTPGCWRRWAGAGAVGAAALHDAGLRDPRRGRQRARRGLRRHAGGRWA